MKVMLDTNLWTYIAEDGLSREIADLENELGVSVVIPPSDLLEAIQTPIPSIRDSIVSAMTARQREHPLPELRDWCMEFVVAVTSLHPDWLRSMPRTDRIPVLENYWRKGVWQQAKTHPDDMSAFLRSTPARDEIGSIQKQNKQELLSSDLSLDVSDLWADPAAGTIRRADVGWGQGRVELWRVEIAQLFWNNLVTVGNQQGVDTSWIDWISPWVDLTAMSRNRGEFNRLWYETITVDHIPRNWLSWAVLTLQLGTKLGSGNAADS